jgi:hypothetical protein
MRFIVLAVTKSYDGFCVAGMNDVGKWIRPISPNSRNRFWTREELNLNGEFAKPGDVWEIQGRTPKSFEFPNHTEDYILSSLVKYTSLTGTQLQVFLESHCEGEHDLSDVFGANGRSLCLIEADEFTHYTTNYENKHRARMVFTSEHCNLRNPLTKDGNIIVKDCRWEGLLLRNINIPNHYENIYVCIGLATPFGNPPVEYPQVVGLHTVPAVKEHPLYPD